jgi:hypothetical protein
LTAALLAPALLVMTCGAAAAWAARHVVKRIAGLLAAMTGAALASAAIGAGEALPLAGVAVALAQTLMGVALAVRLHERYGVGEIPDIDEADARREPAEPDA